MNENISCRQPRTYEMKRYLPNTCIEKYSFMLIRPPRFLYNENIIDPKRKYQNKFQHTVFHIPFPLSLYTQSHIRYVILYLHGNSSSRYEGYCLLAHLPIDVGLACFDFAGCGNRTEQDYISLGKKEALEVDKAVKFLKQKHLKVVVWGRSMGAVSALLSTQCDTLIVDSPFSSLKVVSQQISEKAVPCICLCFFYCIFPCVFQAVSCDVKDKTGVDIDQLNIKQKINININRKIMFLSAKSDKMIHHRHAQELYEEYRGQFKKLMLFEGNHHTDRPAEVLQQAYNFIDEALNPSSLAADSKKQSKADRPQLFEIADVRSFSLLKQQKGDKQLSAKMEIQSKLVQGGQTQKMDPLNLSSVHQSQRQRGLHPNDHIP